MARRKRRRARKRSGRKSVITRAHGRGPRGPDRGKKRVRVRRYRRGRPDPKSYPR